MATNTSYIDGTTGTGKYSSIAAWEADRGAASAADDTEILEISVVGSETGALTVTGWTAKTGGNSIEIKWQGDAYHGGNVNATSADAYVIEKLNYSVGADALISGAFADLAIGSETGIVFNTGSDADVGTVKWLHCIGNANNEGTDIFLRPASATATVVWLGCIALNAGSGSTDYGFDGNGTTQAYHCLAYNCGRGFYQTEMFNCISLDNAVHDVRGLTAHYSIFNTEGGTIVKTDNNNDVGLLTDTDTAAADTVLVADLTADAEDFTPAEFSDTSTYNNIALGAGSDYSGTYAELAADIAGVSRGASPTIGPYEPAGSGSDQPGSFAAAGDGSLSVTGQIDEAASVSTGGDGDLDVIASLSGPDDAGSFSAGGDGDLDVNITVSSTISGMELAWEMAEPGYIVRLNKTISGMELAWEMAEPSYTIDMPAGFAAAGDGDLDVAGQVDEAASVGAGGDGSLDVSAQTEGSASISAGGDGDLDVAGQVDEAASVGAGGDGSLDVTAQTEGSASISAGGDGDLDVSGQVDEAASVGAGGDGSLDVTAQTEGSASISAGGDGDLDVSGQVDEAASVGAGGDGSLDVSADVSGGASVAGGGDGDLDVSGQVDEAASVGAASDGSLSVSSTVEGLVSPDYRRVLLPSLERAVLLPAGNGPAGH